ncbi:MAG: AMP-binding protein, partial [Acidimicrobiales bacterium]
MTPPATWVRDEQHTVLDLLRARVDASPDDPYLDVVGEALTAGEVSRSAARIGGALRALGVQPGDRVASLIENSAEAVLVWFGILWAGGVAVPVNTAYKGEYLRHQLTDCGARALVVQADLAERAERVVPEVAAIQHVVVIDGDPGAGRFGSASTHAWADLLDGPEGEPVAAAPSDLATF